MTAASIDFIRIGPDREEEPRTFCFDADSYHGLPMGTSNRAIFGAAIRNDEGTLIADVLNDTFRYLYYGHFCGQGVDLDREFPFRGAIPEALSSDAWVHRSQRTDTVGSALYLLMSTRAAAENKALLGAIVLAMTRHPKYGGTTDHPVVPTVDERGA